MFPHNQENTSSCCVAVFVVCGVVFGEYFTRFYVIVEPGFRTTDDVCLNRQFIDASRPAFLFITLRQFTVITGNLFCGRSNADELVLELVNLALLEERDELLDILVGFSGMCWSVVLGLILKSGLKVGESDSRVMFSLAIGS